MGWILAVVFVLLAGTTVAATVCGVWRHGLEALTPLGELSVDRAVLLAPSIVEAAAVTVSIGFAVFAFFCAHRTRRTLSSPSANERWGQCCTFGLSWCVLAIGGALAFVMLGPQRGAPPEAIGATTLAAAGQAVVGLSLAFALIFLPKSRATFAALLMILCVEVGSLTGVYLLGSGMLF